MRRWYAVIEKYECRECSEEVSQTSLRAGSCPHCGWTDNKQAKYEAYQRAQRKKP